MKSDQFWMWFDDYAAPKLSGEDSKLSRLNTFRLMMEHLDKFDAPLIIETGCVAFTSTWLGSGCSTLIFDKYVSLCGGNLISIDILPVAIAHARMYVGSNVRIVCNDSVDFFKTYAESDHGNPDLVYLDGSKLDWNNPVTSQTHHLNEVYAILPKLTSDTLVVVDDSPLMGGEIIGKGGLVAKYAKEIGATLAFSEYQSGWVGWSNV